MRLFVVFRWLFSMPRKSQEKMHSDLIVHTHQGTELSSLALSHLPCSSLFFFFFSSSFPPGIMDPGWTLSISFNPTHYVEYGQVVLALGITAFGAALISK